MGQEQREGKADGFCIESVKLVLTGEDRNLTFPPVTRAVIAQLVEQLSSKQ